MTTDHILRRMRLLPLALVAMIVTAVGVTSCSDEKMATEAAVTDPDAVPTMLTRDVSTLISDSGYTRYHITTPLWLMFENRMDACWKFPEGMQLEKYDDNMQVDASIVCDSATYFSQRKLWRLDGNVRMKNTVGDKFLTQQIFWDQDTRTVYSDSFIHIERSNRIIEGYGFTSNEQMTDYVVNRPSGIFPIPDRNAQKADTAAVVADEEEKPANPKEDKHGKNGQLQLRQQ